MPLHPQAQMLLEQMAAVGGTPLHLMSPEEARMIPLADLGVPIEKVAQVEDRTVPGPHGEIPVRIYTPVLGETLPGLVFYHGGGFVVGSLDGHDRECRTLANKSGCVVVSVGYRLAPEHKYPAAVEDSFAATRHVSAHAAEFNIDPNRLAVGGDSAGGNLATVISLMARDQGGPKIALQILIYPCTDLGAKGGTMDEFAEGYFLTRDAADWFYRHYLPPDQDMADPHVSPLFADVSSLPPAFVATAEYDPVRDQGEAYARKLEQAGVPVVARRYDGVFHPFFSLGGIIDPARDLHNDIAHELKRVLGSAAAAH